MGRIVKDKGINELIQAFINIEKGHPEIRLLLIGDYEEELDSISSKSKRYIENNNKIIKTNFLQYLKKIGKVFVFTPNVSNVIKYYDSKSINVKSSR